MLPFWLAPYGADNLNLPAASASAYQQGLFVANIRQQKKRILTNEKARQRNKALKSSLKTAVRGFNVAADAGDAEQAATLAREANRKLDKAASKGVIHKNQAANRKSAIAKRAATL
jgi:small subunit ribosomal protein S20